MKHWCGKKRENLRYAMIDFGIRLSDADMDKTPWTDQPELNAGFAVPIGLKWNQKDFEIHSYSANQYYLNKFNFEEMETAYLILFTNF